MKNKILIGLGLLLVIGGVMFTTVCPCGPTPGAYLFGAEPEAPVTDWSFVNDEPLCQVEVTTWRPHSINLNCMSTPDGQLYVSCSNCASKSWSQTAVSNGEGRIRVGDIVYPVALRRVLDEAELDLAWATRAAKLKRDASPRPDHWWSFNLTSI